MLSAPPKIVSREWGQLVAMRQRTRGRADPAFTSSTRRMRQEARAPAVVATAAAPSRRRRRKENSAMGGV